MDSRRQKLEAQKREAAQAAEEKELLSFLQGYSVDDELDHLAGELAVVEKRRTTISGAIDDAEDEIAEIETLLKKAVSCSEVTSSESHP